MLGVRQLLTEERSGYGNVVYQTYVEFGDQWHVLVTTSQEVHRELGTLSKEELQLLCRQLNKFNAILAERLLS